MIARGESPEWGEFRTGSVGISGTEKYKAPAWQELDQIIVKEGLGISFYYYAPTTSIVVVPVGSVDFAHAAYPGVPVKFIIGYLSRIFARRPVAVG